MWRTFDFFHNTKQRKGTFTRPERAALGNNSSDRKARQSGKAALRKAGEEFDVAVSRTSNVCVNNPVYLCFLTQMGLYGPRGSAGPSLHSRAEARPSRRSFCLPFQLRGVLRVPALEPSGFPLCELLGLHCCTCGLLASASVLAHVCWLRCVRTRVNMFLRAWLRQKASCQVSWKPKVLLKVVRWASFWRIMRKPC